MNVKWIPIAKGRLAVGHRPKMTAFASLKKQGCDSLVTLLSEREGAKTIQMNAEQSGLQWLWLPLENAIPPGKKKDTEIRELFGQIESLLEHGKSVLIHCSAGIHRTGMIAYALLRYLGFEAERATAMLQLLRKETANGVGDSRLEWGERFADLRP